MLQITFNRNLIGLEDLLTGVGTVQQPRGSRTGETTTITKINAKNFPYDASISLATKLQQLEDLANSLSVVDTDGNFVTGFLNTSDGNLDLDGRLWRRTPTDNPTVAELWYGSVKILAYNKTTGELIIPDNVNYIAADAALSATLTTYINTQDAVNSAALGALVASLGTAAYIAVGTGANQIVRLNADSKLPAVDASLLTNVPFKEPIGRISMVPYGTPDEGCFECDGQAISRTTYAALFAKIGTAHGAGDGSTTFNVPDYRGEFLRGWDHGRGVDAGRALNSSQSDEIKSHSHTSTQVSVVYGDQNGGSGARAVSNVATNTGSTGGSETRPRNKSIMFQIRAL